MKYIIIAIGDELLAGQVTDTNSGAIARMMEPHGWELERVEVIADGAAPLRRALEQALVDVDVVLTTGGLGPTKDDTTKQTLCEMFGGSMRHDDEVLANVKRVVEARGLKLNALTAAQARVPDCCRVIQNYVGTAPVMWFDRPEGKVVVSMPGVPFETLEAMRSQVVPMLTSRFTPADSIVRRTTVVSGMSESAIATLLAEWEESLPDYAHLAYLPKAGTVRLRIDGRHRDRQFITNEVERLADELAALIPPESLMAREDILPEQAVIADLSRAGITVATAESCTGGTIASRLTSVAGASATFRGAVVAYSNDAKTGLLGVNPEDIVACGAVSREVVEQMALGAARAFGADMAVATSGIAGPGGGSEEKPTGTVWMAVATDGGREVYSKCYHLPGSRERVIDRASTNALLSIHAIFNGRKTLV